MGQISQTYDYVDIAKRIYTIVDFIWLCAAPIMLLELCEMALKDWLATIKTVSVDILESMLTFTLNIAHGMEYLHSINVRIPTHTKTNEHEHARTHIEERMRSQQFQRKTV